MAISSLEVAEEAADRRPVEQLAPVLEGTEVPGLGAAEGQQQVELRRSVAELEAAQPDVGEVELLLRRVLEDDHRLEHRRAAQVALDPQALDDRLERGVAVRVGVQGDLPHPRQQPVERRVAGEVEAQHQGVDQEADHPFQLAVLAVGDRGAQDDVVLPAVAPQERGEGRHQGHERRRAAPAGHRIEGRGGRLRNPEGLGSSRRAQHRAPRPVVRQLEELRRPGEPLAPVAEEPLEGLPAQPSPLPHREVGVLHRPLRQRRRLPGGQRAVEAADLTDQHPHRPSVGDDVVDGEEQPEPVRGQTQQANAQQRSGQQVERSASLRRRQALGGDLAPAVGQGREIDARQRRRRWRVDDLHRPALAGGEGRAQRLVAPDHLGQGRRQPAGIDRPVETDDGAHVVGRAPRLEPVEEPEPLLAEGEGQVGVAGDRPQLGEAHRQAAPQLAVEALAEAGDGRRGEELPQRDLDPEGVDDPAEQPGGEQRVATEGEEVVLPAHPLDPEEVRPQRRQQLLQRRARRSGPRLAAQLRCGQGGAVELAVGRARQRRELDEGGRDHGVGQLGPQLGAQRGQRQPAALPGDDVGDQGQLAAGVAARHDGGVGERRMAREHGLDLARFDADAADLDLVIEAPEEVELAVRPCSRKIAGGVQPRARNRRERIRHEDRGGAPRLAEIAAADPDAADPQLAGHADRRLQPPPVDHVELQVRHRAADRHRGGGRGGRCLDPRVGDVVRALGRAVGVEQRDPRVAGEPGAAQVRRQRLAGGDHPAQRAQRRPRGSPPLDLLQQRTQHRGHRLEHGDPLPVHGVEQPRRVVGHRVGHHLHPAADGEGRQHLPHRHVEALGRGLCHPVRLAEVELQHLGEQVVLHPPPLHHRSLRHPGRARGEDHVGEARAAAGDGAGAAGRGHRRGVAGGTELPAGDRLGPPRGRHFGQRRGELRLVGLADDHQRGAAALHGLGPAGRRVERVERQPCGPRLEHAEDRRDEVDAAVEEQRDHRLRTDPAARQGGGDRAAPAAQLAVGQLVVAGDRGHRLGPPRGVRREELLEGPVPGVHRPRVVPLAQHLVLLRAAEQGQLPERTVGVCHGMVEETFQLVDEAPGGGRVPQVGGVLGDPGQTAVRRVPEQQLEVELGGAPGGGHRLQGQARKLEPLVGQVLQGEHGLEQGRPRQVALRAHLLHQPLERQVLVGGGGEQRLADPLHRGAQAGGVRQLGADGKGIDEEADQPFELRPRAVGHRGADDDVALARPPRLEGGEAGEQNHELGRLPAPRQPGDGRAPRRSEAHRPAAAAAAHRRRPGAIRRQVERLRRPGEITAPELEVALQPVAGQPPPLPDRVVGVLDRQLGEGIRPAGGEGRVEGADLAVENPHRPPVADRVMQGEAGVVLLAVQAQQEGAQQRPTPQVEGSQGLRVDQPPGGGPPPIPGRTRRGQARQVDHRQPHPRPGSDHLDRLLRTAHQVGAQRLVACRDPPQDTAEDRRVDGPAQPHRGRQVVRRTLRLQAGEQPQAALGEGERQRPVPRHPHQGRLGLRRSAAGEPVAHRPGLVGEERVLEQRAQRQLHREGRADAGEQPGGEQRVAAEGEEVVARRGALDPEDLLPEGAEHLLDGVGLPRRGPLPEVVGAGGGQRRAVDLAVRGARQAVEADDRRRHQIGRQPLGERRPRRRAVRRRGAGDVADQPRSLIVHRGRRLLDAGQRRERRLHLAELDAEAAQLDLVVEAPEEQQVAAGGPAGEVAGAVEAGARHAGVGVGKERLGRRRRPPPVAPRHPGAADRQLARRAGRRQAAPPVENVDPAARDRPTDRHPPHRPVRRLPDGAPDRALGGAVLVVQAGGRQRAPVARDQLRRARLAGDDDGAQGVQQARPVRLRGGRRLLRVLEGEAVERRHAEPVGDPPLGHQLREARRVALLPRRGQHQGAARRQRPEEDRDRAVEGERREEQEPLRRVVVEGDAGGDGRHRVGVRHHHPLGPARRPRRVDGVGRGIGRRRRRRARGALRLVQAEHPCLHRRQPRAQRRGGEQHRRPRVRHQMADPLLRVGRVDGQVGGAGGQGAEDRLHRLRGALEEDPDRGVGTGPELAEPAGQAPGAAGQGTVAELPLAGDHRGRLRGLGGAGEEGAVQRRLRRRCAACRQRCAGAHRRDQVAALGGGEQRQLVEAALRILRGGGEQSVEVTGEALDRRAVEQRAGVLGHPAQPLSLQAPRQRQVEGGAGPGQREGRGLQAGQVEGPFRALLEDQHRLEQRRGPGVAARIDLVDEQLERQVLVGEGIEGGVAHPAQELTEARGARQVGAQRQGVDEQADQALDLRAPAVGHRRPEDQVLLAPVPVDRRRESGEEDHERGHPLGPRQPAKPGAPVRPRRQAQAASLRPPHGVARPVGGQRRERRSTGQALPPVRQLAGQHGAVHPAALPDGEVGVLHRQIRQRARLAPRRGAVDGGELAQEQRLRRAVDGDVVDRPGEHVPAGSQDDEDGGEGRLGGEPERPPGDGGQAAPRFVLGRRGRQGGQVHRGQCRRRGGKDPLVGLAVDVGKGGAQDGLAADHLAQRKRQAGGIEVTVEPEGLRHVVGRHLRLELLEEPHPLLGERQRERLAGARRGQHRRRRERPLAAQVRLQPARQVAEAGRVEDGDQGHLDAEARLEPGDQPGDQQGVAAEGEEVVLPADRLDAEQVAPLRGDDLLDRRRRRASLRSRGGGRRRPRQRPPIDLAVGQPRDRAEPGEGRRDHRLGQPAAQRRAQLGRRGLGAGGGGEPRGEAPLATLPVGEDHRLLHLRQGGEGALDLRRLDPEAAHLDLVVGAAGMDDVARRQVAAEVAGAVDALPGHRRTGVGDEALGGRRRIAEIAAGQVGAADDDLAQLADASLPAVGRGDEELGVLHPAADRPDVAREGLGVAGHDEVRQGALRLRRAVEVDAAHPRGQPVQPIAVPPAQRLADEEDPAQVGQLDTRRHAGGQDPRQGGRQVRRLDPLVAQPDGEAAGGGENLLARDVERGPEPERGEDVALQGVVGEAGEHREAHVGAQREALLHPGQEVGQRAVAPQHAAGAARRPGGEGHAGERLGPDGHAGPPPWRPRIRRPGDGRRAPLPVELQAAEGGALGEHLGERRRRRGAGDLDPRRRARDAQLGGQPRSGVGRIEHGERGARFEHPEDRRHQRRAARAVHRDDVLRADAEAGQAVGDHPPAPRQLGEGPRAVAGGQRRPLRVPAGERREALVDRSVPGRVEGAARVGEPAGGRAGRQADLADAALRPRDDLLEDLPVLRAELLHPLRREEVGVEEQADGDPLRPVLRVDGEIELAADHRWREDLDLESGQLDVAEREAQHVEEDLEEGGAAQPALGPQLGDQLLEGGGLVGIGVDGGPPHPGEQLAERRIAGEVGAQHQGVEKDADQVLHLAALAPGDGRPDDHVRAAGVAPEEHREGGEQGHEGRRALRPAEGAQRRREGGRQAHAELAGAEAAARRTRPVEGEELALRRIGQRLAPVGEVGVQRAARRPLALPHREVGVLDRQLRQPRLGARGEGGVERPQLADQDADRPAIRHRVVEGQQQAVLAAVEAQQRGAAERTAGEVEAPPGVVVGPAVGLSPPPLGRQPGEVDPPQPQGGGRPDHLGHLALDAAESGAEHLVPAADPVDRRRQRRGMELTAQDHRRRQVVGSGGAFEPVEKPDPLLREGGRDEQHLGLPGSVLRAAAGGTGQRRAGGRAEGRVGAHRFLPGTGSSTATTAR